MSIRAAWKVKLAPNYQHDAHMVPHTYAVAAGNNAVIILICLSMFYSPITPFLSLYLTGASAYF